VLYDVGSQWQGFFFKFILASMSGPLQQIVDLGPGI
jgi:hypothetical protein